MFLAPYVTDTVPKLQLTQPDSPVEKHVVELQPIILTKKYCGPQWRRWQGKVKKGNQENSLRQQNVTISFRRPFEEVDFFKKIFLQ